MDLTSATDIITGLKDDNELLWMGVIALVLALLALFFFIHSLKTLLRGRLAGAGGRLLLGAVLLVLGGVLLLVISNLYVYEQLTHEREVATVRLERVGDHHFRLILKQPEGVPREFDVLGDEWQLDARILKWQGPVQLLGLRNRYRLERVQGRYRSVGQERRNNRTVYDLAEQADFDLWKWMATQPDWLVWVDAYFGSSTYLPMADGAAYNVVITTNGLLARPANEVARAAIARW